MPALTDIAIRTAKPAAKDYKLYDQLGLFLTVRKSGSKSFYLRYSFAGKEKKLALGRYPEVSLKIARQKRDEARAMLAEHQDPSIQRKLDRAMVTLSADNTFQTIANEWVTIRLADKSESHQKKTRARLDRYINPAIGSMPVGLITPVQVLSFLRPIEAAGKIERAHRLKQLISQIMRFAIVTGRAERDPAADLRGALRTPKVTHLAAITQPQVVGQLLRAIQSLNGSLVVRAALHLSPLLMLRPGELRQLKWADVNWSAQRLEIRAQKTDIDHVVPLASQALDILSSLQAHTGRGIYIFPSARGASRPMSENAVRTALRSLEYRNEDRTPHGFRAMARTLLDEELRYPIEWIELQLAHAVRDVHGKAYNRTQHIEGRIAMMQAWADYLDALRDGKTALKR